MTLFLVMRPVRVLTCGAAVAHTETPPALARLCDFARIRTMRTGLENAFRGREARFLPHDLEVRQARVGAQLAHGQARRRITAKKAIHIGRRGAWPGPGQGNGGEGPVIAHAALLTGKGVDEFLHPRIARRQRGDCQEAVIGAARLELGKEQCRRIRLHSHRANGKKASTAARAMWRGT